MIEIILIVYGSRDWHSELLFFSKGSQLIFVWKFRFRIFLFKASLELAQPRRGSKACCVGNLEVAHLKIENTFLCPFDQCCGLKFVQTLSSFLFKTWWKLKIYVPLQARSWRLNAEVTLTQKLRLKMNLAFSKFTPSRKDALWWTYIFHLLKKILLLH